MPPLPHFNHDWRIPELPGVLLGILKPHELELLALIACCLVNNLERSDAKGGIDLAWFGRHLGKTRRQIKRTMGSLVAKGYVKIHHRQSKPSHYEVTWPW